MCHLKFFPLHFLKTNLKTKSSQYLHLVQRLIWGKKLFCSKTSGYNAKGRKCHEGELGLIWFKQQILCHLQIEYREKVRRWEATEDNVYEIKVEVQKHFCFTNFDQEGTE